MQFGQRFRGASATGDTGEPPDTRRLSWRKDRAGVAALIALTAIAAILIFRGGAVIGQDSATQFYPWYDYLGERLRGGEIPGWNPYQFSGAPFAADPQSGWMYLPAMVLFSVFPISVAVPVFIVFHLALAGSMTYLLARLLGMGVAASVVAATAYELAGPMFGRSVCCPAHTELGAWVPVALVGAELAVRTRDRARRIFGWCVAALAVSQALAVWLGQGGYYFLLFLAAYIAYRTMLAPDDRGRRWGERSGDALLHGGVIFVTGFGLAAAGVLPRLAYVARSNVAGGEYNEAGAWAADIGGVTPAMVAARLLDPGLYYPGVAVLVLALPAIVIARGRYGSGFFFATGIGAMVLAIPWTTPLHLLLYATLPRFEELHRHWPERVAIVSYLVFAMLAGAAVEAIRSGQCTPRRALLASAVPAGIIFGISGFHDGIPWTPIAITMLAFALVASLALARTRVVRLAVPPLLAVVVATDLLLSFSGVVDAGPFGGFARVDLGDYFAPTDATAFLQRRMADEPARYVGFDDQHAVVADGQLILYRYQFADNATTAILVNNRGVLHGIQDVQGYNPVQPERYVDYLTALNGHRQEYHDANVYADGFASPLFDLLNIRYIVIPATWTGERPDLEALVDAFPAVHVDEQVMVLENQDALPRAWIVHEAQVAEPEDALELLATGAVDPRLTALLESPAPEVAQPPGGETSTATLVEWAPERIRVDTRAAAPGLLMLSEPYDAGWRAFVDGEEVELLPADALLRAVPIPAGDHVVELRYEPVSLTVGLVISALTATVVLSSLAWAVWSLVLGHTMRSVRG